MRLTAADDDSCDVDARMERKEKKKEKKLTVCRTTKQNIDDPCQPIRDAAGSLGKRLQIRHPHARTLTTAPPPSPHPLHSGSSIQSKANTEKARHRV